MRFVIIASISAIAALAASPNLATQMVSIEGQDFRSRATTMNEMSRHVGFFLLVINIWFTLLVNKTVGYAADKKPSGGAVYGFQVFGQPAWSPDRKTIAFTVVPSTVWSRVLKVGGFPYDGSKIWLLEIGR